MIEFQECAACAAKSGSPYLCAACLHNRALVGRLDALIALANQPLPLSEKEVRAALHAGHVERRVAEGDNAWTSLVRQRDRALADTDTAIAIGGDFVAARDRLRAALDHLRKNIDGYNAIFEIAEEIAAGKIAAKPSATSHAPIATADLSRTPARIIRCSCGWQTPPSATDSDDAFAQHVMLERPA